MLDDQPRYKPVFVGLGLEAFYLPPNYKGSRKSDQMFVMNLPLVREYLFQVSIPFQLIWISLKGQKNLYERLCNAGCSFIEAYFWSGHVSQRLKICLGGLDLIYAPSVSKKIRLLTVVQLPSAEITLELLKYFSQAIEPYSKEGVMRFLEQFSH
jgi:hypothetical protein